MAERPADLLRTPYVFEFLKIPEPHQVSQTEFETLLVEHATCGMSSQLFVQKYQLYLPDREVLRTELEETLRVAGQPTRQAHGTVLIRWLERARTPHRSTARCRSPR
ncbi:hypothetical protein OOZ63_11150 [Paucibacter sp. PLA-PC-4]|uniref:hypothetical protein n=1 Tax=Paucibacter sp. PLA-PC-4 TaxID=2993655 RepID=UPI002248C01E|nr:hypothetical protein [Paucibacter sp. PLA-PC-4]MCX2862398.1 hypothetical protein [Paucibacter sp. PLA-PC-4]